MFGVLCGLLVGCASDKGPSVGETRTIADAEDTGERHTTQDWPCFVDRSEYDVWFVNGGDDQKEDTIEQSSALWLEPGDTVKVLQVDSPPSDALKVRIKESPTGESGKACWTEGYQGALFSK